VKPTESWWTKAGGGEPGWEIVGDGNLDVKADQYQ
jgi:hypothetical protein